MPKLRTIHRCTDCGNASPRWSGRCGACGAWNTLIEEVDEARPPAAALTIGDRPVPLADVDLAEWAPVPTGIAEFDRVLGGGLVPGSATVVGGEPGIGKSTLLLQALSSLAARGRRCLLVTAEESKQQVKLRAERLGARSPNLWLVAETSLPGVLAALGEVEPDVVVVDSIQTVHDPDLGSAPGSVAQVRECAHQLVRVAKERGLTTVLVGHVTKEGTLAGPRVLEHLVDTVLSFEGERHHALRLLRAAKHRFGPTGELGLFEMADDGLRGVPDPSGLFLGDRREGVPGSVVVPALEGQRPLLVEIQSLVASSALAMPRRSAQGLDSGRLSLLIAVLDRRVGLSLAGADVFASAVGGAKVVEPAADLAVGLALASALTGQALPPELVACGEVGLGGEVRQVGQTARRLAEAARLGFRTAVVPASAPEVPAGMQAIRVRSLAEAVQQLGLRPSGGAGSQ
ncbi:MAG TPA: DNA repair protein RadA [Acidimicrobiales bacterium]|nr:DNA repair protein RadA [Acidimicrobiales bacterium]